mgnify:FL=1|jgi:hypothetical protein
MSKHYLQGYIGLESETFAELDQLRKELEEKTNIPSITRVQALEYIVNEFFTQKGSQND